MTEIELCGAIHPDPDVAVRCGMPVGPNAVTADGAEVHVHAGYGGDEIPPGKFRWETPA